MSKSLCLTDIEASVLVDVLYDFIGQYSTQSLGVDTFSGYDDAVFASILYKLNDGCEGVAPMSCLDVANCIETSQEVKNVLQTLSTTNSYISDSYNYSGKASTTAFLESIKTYKTPDSCSPDNHFGGCLAIVNNIANTALEILERLQAMGTDLERIRGVANSIPLISTWVNSLGINGASEFATWATAQALEDFKVEDSEQSRLTLACVLFCATRGQCGFSPKQLEETFSANSFGGDLTLLSDITLMCQTIITGVMVGNINYTALYYSMLWFTAVNINRGGYMFGYKPVTLQYAYAIGVDSPTDAWVLGCGCESIVENFHDFDFTGGTQGWQTYTGLGANYAEYVTGQGWRRASAKAGRLDIVSPAFTGTVTRIVVTHSKPAPVSSGGRSEIFRGATNALDAFLAYPQQYPTAIDDYDYTFSVNQSFTNRSICLGYRRSTSETSPAFEADFYVTNVRVYFVGSDPF